MNIIKLLKHVTVGDVPLGGCRAVIGGCLLCAAFVLMGVAAAPGGDSLSTAGSGLLAMGCLVAGVLILAPTTVPLAVRPLTALVDRLYFGEPWREPPPVNLKLARAYHRAGRLEEAALEYARIRGYHPANVEVLAEGILTLRALGDGRTATRWLRKGLRRVKTAEGRARLNKAMTSPALAPVDRSY